MFLTLNHICPNTFEIEKISDFSQSSMIKIKARSEN